MPVATSRSALRSATPTRRSRQSVRCPRAQAHPTDCKLTRSCRFHRRWMSGTMVTKIFHPNVSKQGEICVDTLKKGWTPETGIRCGQPITWPWLPKPHLTDIVTSSSAMMNSHILSVRRLAQPTLRASPFLADEPALPSQVVRCLLIYPNPESALDEEAGKLLLEAYED